MRSKRNSLCKKRRYKENEAGSDTGLVFFLGVFPNNIFATAIPQHFLDLHGN